MTPIANNNFIWYRRRRPRYPSDTQGGLVTGTRLIWLGVVVVVLLSIRFILLPATTPPNQEETMIPSQAIESARIYPDPAYTRNALAVRFDNPAHTEPPGLRMTWLRNGQAIPGADGRQLDPGLFARGDQVAAEITTVDSTGAKTSFRTVPVRIANTPPRIVRAETAIGTRDAPEIYVNLESLDADGDPVRYTYRWFKNGRLLDGQTSATLSPGLARRGDQVFAEVTAGDGEDVSAPLRSSPVEIENHAPRILSSPDSSTTRNGKFVYQLQAEDADGDPLLYELLEGPEQMTMDDAGRLEWIVPRSTLTNPTATVKVRVLDERGGEAIQEFSVSIGAR